MKIYVASKTKYADTWKQLREQGLGIISSWIDEAGQGETVNPAVSFLRFCREVKDSSLFVLFAMKEDVMKGAYIELGIAIAEEIPVIIFCEELNQPNLKSIMVNEYPLLLAVVEGIPSIKSINDIYYQYENSLI